MADYTGAQREFYNIRRQLQTRIAGFEKAGMRLPPEWESSRIQKILDTTPAKAGKGLMAEASLVKQQIAGNPSRYTAAGMKRMYQGIIKKLSAPPRMNREGENVGGLGYEMITGDQELRIFGDFMEWVRDKFEGMAYDSGIAAAAANEMIKNAKRRNIPAEALKENFERFYAQAMRATESESASGNYQQNFNRLSRRLGL